MFLLVACLLSLPEGTAGLQVVFSNLRQPTGRVYIAVFDSKAAYLQTEEARFQKIVPVQSAGTVEVNFSDIPAGAYALSCFHDINGNGRLDTNWLGIPTEPYCFSNNARPRFRAPTWEETKFVLEPGKTVLRLQLEKW